MVINNELGGFVNTLSVSRVLRKAFAEEIVEGHYRRCVRRFRPTSTLPLVELIKLLKL
jgi:hypothetical protein